MQHKKDTEDGNSVLASLPSSKAAPGDRGLSHFFLQERSLYGRAMPFQAKLSAQKKKKKRKNLFSCLSTLLIYHNTSSGNGCLFPTRPQAPSGTPPHQAYVPKGSWCTQRSRERAILLQLLPFTSSAFVSPSWFFPSQSSKGKQRSKT